MSPRAIGFQCRYIVVADDDRTTLNLVIETLLNDGHAVFQAYDGLRAVQLAVGLKVCDLVISNTRVGGLPGPELIAQLREYMPDVAILYLAHPDHSTPDIEEDLPANVPILREPFDATELRRVVRRLLNRRGRGARSASAT
jgi:DNA-binding response OmpR family regulator